MATNKSQYEMLNSSLHTLKTLIGSLPDELLESIKTVEATLDEAINDVLESIGNKTGTILEKNPTCPKCGTKTIRTVESGRRLGQLTNKQQNYFIKASTRERIYICSIETCPGRVNTVEMVKVNNPYAVVRSPTSGKGNNHGIDYFDVEKLASSLIKSDDSLSIQTSLDIAWSVHAEIFERMTAIGEDTESCTSKEIGETILDVLFQLNRLGTWYRYILYYKGLMDSKDANLMHQLLEQYKEKCMSSELLIKKKTSLRSKEAESINRLFPRKKNK